MTISDLKAELKNSMLQKDAEKTSVIRMLMSAISYTAMSKNKKDDEMTEEELNSVVLKELKTRSEAIEEFETNGKIELAMKEKSELEILKQFAPKMMSDDEVAEYVKNILGENKAIAVGPAIGMVMKKLKGKADPALVNKAVNDYLKS